MAGNRLRRRRRDEGPTSLDLLLDDPEAIRAANDAFALAERPDSAAWPFVASVGLETVALRWAGASVPAPTAPWRAGYDARVWVADRAELAETDAAAASGRGATAVLVGWFEETLVCINTSRAPGPIAVDGHDEPAELLRELVARQTLVQPRTPLDGPGAWWPMEVGGGVIQLLGLAVARTFAPEQAKQAGELVRLVAALELVRRTEDEAAATGTGTGTIPIQGQPAAATTAAAFGAADAEPEVSAEDALELWLDQVKAAAAQVAVGAYQGAMTGEAPMDVVEVGADVDVVEAAEPEPEPEPEPVEIMSVSSADVVSASSAPTTATSGPEPTPAQDDLDDWAAGFAVSSADQTNRR